MATTTSPGDTADAAVKYAFFGTTRGAGNEQLNQPLGMAFNHDKTEIFVADSNNNRVQVLKYDKVTGDLNFVRVISDKIDNTGRNNGTFNKPSGVASGIDNTKPIILVADTDNHNVCWFNDDGSNHYIGQLDANKPCSVAVDKDGTFFAYDSTNCRIEITMNDSSTKYICDKGADEGQLGGWGTLAFDNDDNLVVADEDNNRVQVLNRNDGKHIRTITDIIESARGGQLKAPCGIAFTDDGEHIIIADAGNNRVCVLKYLGGVIVNTFGGTKGTKLGEFDGPYGVLVDDENGRIIVSEENNHRIQVIHNALPHKKLTNVDDKSSLGPSKSKYPNLEIAIRNAIIAFSNSLGSGDEYVDILNELTKKIDEDRKRISNPDLLLSELLTKVTRVTKRKKEKTKTEKPLKTAVKKAESQLKSKDDVTKFISSQKDAIFVVTGGSFNPPHNGHIGMFQKAYEALMKVDINKGKKVYGVMVPATDDWIEDKLCKEVNGGTPCTTPEQRNFAEADIKLKRIQVAERVKLCKLSCESYEWKAPSVFGAENMIVVNESGEGEEFTSAENTYYLCGSDYYKDTPKIKYICVLRQGDVKKDTKLTRTKGGKPEIIVIKDTDIIIEGGEDNDASSTMLRNILTEISKFKISEDDTELPTFPDKDKKLLALISIPVLRKLLDLKYILTDTDKVKLTFMGIELDAPDEKSSNDTDDTLKRVSDIIRSGPRSLCNIGCMCYMNAALQLIYSMPDFITAIKTPNPLLEYLNTMDKGVSFDQARVLAKRLYDLAQSTSGKAFTIRDYNQQEDASELITTVLSRDIFDTSKDSMEFTSAAALIYNGSASISDKCKSIYEDSKKMVPDSDRARLISLYQSTKGTVLMASILDGTRELTTFKDVFDAYRNSSTDREEKFNDSADALDGKNLSTNANGIISNLPECMMNITTDPTGKIISKILKPVCNPLIGVENSSSKYKLTHLKDKTYISIGPTQKYFIVILKRTISDDKGIQTKLQHSVDLTNARIEIGGRPFIITGCICHHGPTSTSGHYTYVEFENGNPKTVYDDHNIVRYDVYVNMVKRNVNTEGYVLLFEREETK